MQAELVELARYRLEKAKECLRDAQDAALESRLANSVNRSYYSMFHATRALLALSGFDSQKHSSIIGYFNQHYVAKGEIDPVYHQMLSNAFRDEIRPIMTTFFFVSRDEAEQQLDNAVKFVAALEKYIDKSIHL